MLPDAGTVNTAQRIVDVLGATGIALVVGGFVTVTTFVVVFVIKRRRNRVAE